MNLTLVAQLVLFMVLAVTACNKLDNKHVVRYNCDLAEISPDFPLEIKKQCRELYKNENRSMQ